MYILVKKRLKLFFLGTTLFIGWTIILGVTTWLQDLPCALSPTNCSRGQGLAQVILFVPLIVGSALIPAGMFTGLREKSFPRPLKVLVGIAIMAVLLFIAFEAITYIGIASHGLGG